MKNFNKLLMAVIVSLSLGGFKSTAQESNLMTVVYTSYFGIKDALVKSDGNTASMKAAEMTKAITAVSIDQMKSEDHTVWMKVLPALMEDAENISNTKDAKRQRDFLVTLSKNIHELMKAFPAGETVYFQKCPMANGGKGANWLSKEKSIKNPYYGSAMLTCGSTVETLK